MTVNDYISRMLENNEENPQIIVIYDDNHNIYYFGKAAYAPLNCWFAFKNAHMVGNELRINDIREEENGNTEGKETKMKLSNERFEIEIISKSEFVDDYSAENKNFLVTIWNIHVSGEALWRWLTSEMPDSDTFFNSREEYIAEVQRCENVRREFKEKIEKFLGQENVNISQAHAEFFTAIKIEEIDNK